MKVTVRPRWWEGASTPTIIVDVAADGTVTHGDRVVGRLVKASRTWERRTPGKTYVNARGSVVEWQAWLPGSRSLRPDRRGDSRGEAIRKLVEARVSA